MSLPGFLQLEDLPQQHNEMHRKLFQFTLAVLPKTFTSAPTKDQLPPGYAAYYDDGSGTRRLYFNIGDNNVYAVYNTLYSTTAPNGNITDIRGRFCLYYDGSSYSIWVNTDGATTWQEISSIFEITADLILGSTNAVYWGAKTTNGTWRIIRSGNDLVVERRESGSYVEKGKFSP